MFGPMGTNIPHILSVNTHTDSDFAFLVPQMIYLLDRNQSISHSVNKSERHHALSEIAKFISLSILCRQRTHNQKNKQRMSPGFVQRPLMVVFAENRYLKQLNNCKICNIFC